VDEPRSGERRVHYDELQHDQREMRSRGVGRGRACETAAGISPHSLLSALALQFALSLCSCTPSGKFERRPYIFEI
jgi:hypothetical protein